METLTKEKLFNLHYAMCYNLVFHGLTPPKNYVKKYIKHKKMQIKNKTRIGFYPYK